MDSYLIGYKNLMHISVHHTDIYEGQDQVDKIGEKKLCRPGRCIPITILFVDTSDNVPMGLLYKTTLCTSNTNVVGD